ncbi:S24 family peptidase, partial [Bacillus thuringiensis]|nr:S24 family peptidase [Bacillus thuringiensis]
NYEEYRCEATDHLPGGNLVYLKAKGNSMEPTIPDGAYVMVREQPDVESGEIAAVLVNGDTEATLKRIKKQGDIIMLMPDNPTHNPMIIDENNPAKIIGKAIRFTQDL